jgi:formylglycine-generating enzyme required for sulfatase activity
VPVESNVVECGGYHPAQLTAACADGKSAQLCGDVWEWTRSAYPPYPGFCPAAGSRGEYNGTFMCDQYVLSGGSCATSRAHVRATNRNYVPAGARWQLTGIRLANEAAR